ncbi:hypothetical protein [Leptolyngbya sp. O-77]|uniref:hypothetical protein n=1 Tax=Leptolyngbya sp. O-77 TaxID=1080068 RepID=UPI00074D303D|nr:hypothetical protein [Leptolyngbya sp. O-77]BAU42828.1 hypothetical protein O77CONTIG1_02650 [Leptolyngbya sp. O-77]
MKLYMLNIQSCHHLLNAARNAKRKPKAYSWLNAFWRAIAQRLTNRNEPRIHTIETPIGQTIWQIYDPITGHKTWFSTEAEVRIWLDQRFQN